MNISIELFYVPCGSKSEATDLGNAAVQEGLAACYNYFDIKSGYFWEESMQNEAEVLLLLKTSRAVSGDLSNFLEKRHAYDTPCIAHWPIAVNKSYADWITKNTR